MSAMLRSLLLATRIFESDMDGEGDRVSITDMLQGKTPSVSATQFLKNTLHLVSPSCLTWEQAEADER